MPSSAALESRKWDDKFRKWDASDAGKTGHPRTLIQTLFYNPRVRVRSL